MPYRFVYRFDLESLRNTDLLSYSAIWQSVAVDDLGAAAPNFEANWPSYVLCINGESADMPIPNTRKDQS
jgi:hypothetical protein